jgi:phosphoglycerate dehydrogenase-like enzyme
MKSDAVLINTSDSSVVDEEAVIQALERGEIAGYATDCPSDVVSAADESLAASGKLIVTTNPLTNQIGAPQQIAKYVIANVEAFKSKSTVRGVYEPVDFPTIGDPSFWSSRMSPRQD